jgi:hypothetical protein
MEKTEFKTNDHTCGNCRLAYEQNGTQQIGNRQLQCRRYPPAAQLLVGLDPDKGPQHFGTIGSFVPVQAVHWCGEWAAKLDS